MIVSEATVRPAAFIWMLPCIAYHIRICGHGIIFNEPGTEAFHG